jgi:serine/threonine-protein kinase
VTDESLSRVRFGWRIPVLFANAKATYGAHALTRVIDDWAVLSPLLDQALAHEGESRERWLATLMKEQPALGATVASLLADQPQIEATDFLGTEAVRPSPAGLAGEVIGAYTLTQPLGEGGMGTVWLAHRSDGSFEGQVAVKFLSAAVRGPAAARFRREGSLLAQLTHPNIARLIDAGIALHGQPYLVLEYVDGERIDAYCKTRQLDVDACLHLFLDVLAAVSDAHRKLIVHRDIKPSNVFVRHDGVVKLIDFGIAKLIDDEVSDDALTRDGAGAFTPEYAAPEQIRGETVTTATDIYALGVLLFELLTGQRPFTRAVKLAAGERLTELEPPLPSTRSGQGKIKQQLEGDIDNIVVKAMRAEPRERYGSVDAFADDLRRYLAHEPVTAHSDTFTYRARKFIRRHRGSVFATLLTAMALIVATIITTMQSVEAQRQRDEAQQQLRRALAYNDFVTSLLSQAGPDGRGLTPVELLDRGMDAIRERYGEDPQFAISMLQMLSGRYMDLGRTDREYAALLEAEALARTTGDDASLLNVLCNTVETEVVAGRRDAAQAHMQEARQLLGKLGQHDAMLEVNCLRQEAALIENENVSAAIAYLERAKSILEANGRIHGNVYSGLMSWLGAFNHDAGRYLAALHYHEQELDLMVRHKRQQTVEGATTRLALAHNWYVLGEAQRAVALYEAETANGSARLELYPALAINYGLALSAIGRDTDALAQIERGSKAAKAANQRHFEVAGLYARTLALVNAGHITEAQATLLDYESMIQGDVNPVPRSHALELRAAIEFALRHDGQAAAAADAALGLLGYPDAPLGSRPATALTLRSRIRTAAGDAPAAIADAQAAVAMLEADVVDPKQSATVGAARLALAQAERAAGDAESARRDAASAYLSLSNGLGADHPQTRLAAALRDGV